MSKKINIEGVSPGLYRVFWASGGMSDVAIGMGEDGDRLTPLRFVTK